MTRKSSLFAACIPLLILAATALAQEPEEAGPKTWKKSLVIDVTTTQTAYSDSWVGGEAGSFNWVSNLNGAAERQLREWLNFRSALKLSFGQTYSQNADTKDWRSPEKSTDLIDWDNLGRFTVNSYVDPYAAFRLESQFLDATLPDKDRYFSPLRLTESVGGAHRFYERDNDHVTSRLGLALRQQWYGKEIDTVLHIVEDLSENDGGIESVTDVSLTLNDRLSYTGKLTLFKALFYSESDEVKGEAEEDYWKAVDVNWENTLSASVSKIITVNLYTQFLYDKQISRRGRLKETLGIGFVFKMI